MGNKSHFLDLYFCDPVRLFPLIPLHLFLLLLLLVVFREISLQNADEDEQGQEKRMKKKRKVPEPDRENDVEHWVMKRQRLKAIKGEEAMKRKRTVFVGNLPVGCTKKVRREQRVPNHVQLKALLSFSMSVLE